MMAALLLVFVLVIVFTISQAKASYEEEEAKLKQQNEALIEQNEAIKEYQEKVENQQEQLDKIVGVRTEIIEKLTEEFKDTDLKMTIDEETGAICFDSNLLFDYNKHNLKKSGIQFLNEFFPKYFEVILSDDIRQYVSEIIIEGHTDDKGDYLYNLELSQKRAFEVAEYCLCDDNNMFTKKQLEDIRSIVTANGKSYYGLVYKDKKQTVIDAAASRRVEVKFRLTEEEMIKEVAGLLEE